MLGDVIADDGALQRVERQEAGIPDVEAGTEAGQADCGVEAVDRLGLFEALEELRHGQAVLLGDEGGGERNAGEVVEEGVGKGGGRNGVHTGNLHHVFGLWKVNPEGMRV